MEYMGDHGHLGCSCSHHASSLSPGISLPPPSSAAVHSLPLCWCAQRGPSLPRSMASSSRILRPEEPENTFGSCELGVIWGWVSGRSSIPEGAGGGRQGVCLLRGRGRRETSRNIVPALHGHFGIRLEWMACRWLHGLLGGWGCVGREDSTIVKSPDGFPRPASRMVAGVGISLPLLGEG